MKKISKVLLCAALTGAMAVGAAGAADLGTLSPQGAKAYLDQIVKLQNQYGKAYSYNQLNPHIWKGLCLATLIDMDKDGIPELYCSASTDGQSLYTYANGQLNQLNIPKQVSNFGTDYCPSTEFQFGKSNIYLVDGQEIMNGGPVSYLTKRGDEIVSDFTYINYQFTNNPVYKVNGQSVSRTTLEASIKNFEKDLTEKKYIYFSEWTINSPSGTVANTITSLRKLTNPTAKVSTHKVTLNGAKADLAAYTINGSNYFKLRDLAKALDGLNTNFEVKWNAAQQRIDLTSKTAYIAVGGEQAALPAGNKAASLTNASVYLDGKPLSLTAYSIGGNNYFKLRDLGDALGFGVDWNADTMTMILTVK